MYFSNVKITSNDEPTKFFVEKISEAFLELKLEEYLIGTTASKVPLLPAPTQPLLSVKKQYQLFYRSSLAE